MRFSNRITWSAERQKWLCYDDELIDLVVNSNCFVVPTYDYAGLEKKFNKEFDFTKKVISHFPLANDGDSHVYLRQKMSNDINANLKKAIDIFKENFESKINGLVQRSGSINIAMPIIESILESNWAFANIDLGESIDYSDLTLMLDDSQSIKSRMLREDFIKLFISRIKEDDCYYKLALISVGVNALISTTLHSFIKILTNFDYQSLISRKYFYANGIKHLERVCVIDTEVGGKKIKVGERLRLFVENYEYANLSNSQMNKKFFAAESNHACIGMNYSLSIWKELIKIIQNIFTDMTIVDYNYRSNDSIFHFPTNIYVEYSR